MTAITKKARPLSPHLGIYKPQLSSGTSIVHRFTGIGLWLGLPVLSVFLLALANSREVYDMLITYVRTIVGQALLAAWVWALLYHFCNGIRYLIWGTARMMTIEAGKKSALIVIAISLVATGLIWCAAYGVFS